MYSPYLVSYMNRIRIATYKPTGNLFEDRLRLYKAHKYAEHLGNPPGCVTMEEMIKNLEMSIAAHVIQKQWRASYYNPDYEMGLRRVERFMDSFVNN
jgi:hypothetical protein